ncbi:MAG: extracellular solute-binding protein [Chloroflexota bacterium]
MLTRRGVLRRWAWGAIALLGTSVLDACAPAPTAAPATRPPLSVSPAAPSAAILPTYVPFSGPRPDLPGAPSGAEPGYLTFPKNLVTSITETPARGGDITAVVQSTRPPAPGVPDNATWQEVNHRIGANLKLVISSDVDYKTRFATTIASGDIPDLLSIPLYQNPAGMYGSLRALFADLTPFLAGDAVRDYPHLANIPSFHWKNVANAGAIYGVPVPNTVFLNAKYVNQTLLDQVGMSAGPKTLDELTRLMKAFTRPQDNLYATAYATGGSLEETFIKEIFRVPNNWRRDPDGALVKDLESEERKAAVAYSKSLVDSGAFHPGLGQQSTAAMVDAFAAGQLATFTLGFPSYQNIWDKAAVVNPSTQVRTLLPFGADGGNGAFYTTNGTQPSVVALKKASPDRIKELLRVLNFLAAPFGTTEHLLLGYGVEGTDFRFDGNGAPIVTEKGQQDLNAPFSGPGGRALGGAPPFLFHPRSTAFTDVVHADEESATPILLLDPTQGRFSTTDASKGAILRQMITDRIQAILVGQAPMSDYDQLVADWRSQGGDQIRAEYLHALDGTT